MIERQGEIEQAVPYSSMSWQDFEDHVISLLARIYAGYGFKIIKTPYQNDGGRDGHGSLVIGPPKADLGLEFSIVARIWAEVKKRSTSSVDIDDLGGHLILALDQKINKLVFVTNSKFSERARTLSIRVADRLAMGVVFIDGVSLADLEARLAPISPKAISGHGDLKAPLGAESGTSGPRIRFGFASTPDGTLLDMDADLELDVGEVGYWICEVAGGNGSRGHVDASPAPDCHLRSVFLSPQRVELDGMEIYQRVVAAVWSEEAGWHASDSLLVSVTASLLAGVNFQRGSGQLKFRSSVLSAVVPSSRQVILDSVTTEYEIVSNRGGVACITIEAVGGAGKTFLLHRLRKAFLESGSGRHIHLDAARDVGLDAVVMAILRQTLPLPSDIMMQLRDEVLADWLTKGGTATGAATHAPTLPSLLAGRGISSEDQNVIDCLASVLINASSQSVVTITFEDVHKASPAVSDFFQRLVGVIAARHKGRVLILLTTRPVSGNSVERTGKSSGGATRDVHCRIAAFTRDEAIALLRNSLRGLAFREAEEMVELIGTSPFALREALQFLRTNGAVDVSPNGFLFLARTEALRTTIRSGTLRNATRERLLWLIERCGGWLASFLFAGACLGKQFDVEHALATIDDDFASTFDRAVALCFDYDVLKPLPVRSRGEIAFDHDLVRSAVLEIAGAKRVAMTSGVLLDSRTSIPDRERAILSYLAGRADDCIAAAEQLLASARSNKNRLEAVWFALLRVVPLIASGTTAGKADFLIPHVESIDEALAYASAPRLHDRPSDRRMIQAFRDLLGEMQNVGMLEGALAERIITLGQMHAGYVADDRALSEFIYFDGRRLFGTNRYADAYRQFLEAERIWPGGTTCRTAELAPIRLRQAICERHLGELSKARATLDRAIRLRQGADWSLFEEVVANLGAFCMYDDQPRAAAYWRKGLRVARHCGHVETTAHFLNDLAHIALMSRNYVEALALLGDAEKIIESHGLRKELTRTNILRASVFLCLGRLTAAAHALTIAEDAALANGDLRRLWRVRANMATLAELRDQWEEAIIHDLQALSHMPISVEFDGSGTIGGRANRVTGALINIVERATVMPEAYIGVRKKLGDDVWRSAVGLASDLPRLGAAFAGGIACLHHPVGSGEVSRFLITE